jgi:hypothetical protein
MLEPTIDKRKKGGGIEGTCYRACWERGAKNKTMMVVALEVKQ